MWPTQLHLSAPNPSEANLILIILVLKAELARPTKQAHPMTPQLLREIYDHVDHEDPVELVCYTAILVGFNLFLHKSNLVPDSSNIFNPDEQLTRADALLAEWMVLICLRWNKTITIQAKRNLYALNTCTLQGHLSNLGEIHVGKIACTATRPAFFIPQERENGSFHL